MTLTIDKFGRFVLPKRLREHLGVGPGLEVEVTEAPGSLVFKPKPRESGLMRKNGLLIMKPLPGDNSHIDWDNLVNDEREERIRKLAGQ